MIGASFDSPADNAAFAAKYDLPFPLLSMEDRSVAMALGACERESDEYPRRITYVIDSEGKVEQAIETKDPGGQAAALLG